MHGAQSTASTTPPPRSTTTATRKYHAVFVDLDGTIFRTIGRSATSSSVKPKRFALPKRHLRRRDAFSQDILDHSLSTPQKFSQIPLKLSSSSTSLLLLNYKLFSTIFIQKFLRFLSSLSRQIYFHKVKHFVFINEKFLVPPRPAKAIDVVEFPSKGQSDLSEVVQPVCCCTFIFSLLSMFIILVESRTSMPLTSLHSPWISSSPRNTPTFP